MAPSAMVVGIVLLIWTFSEADCVGFQSSFAQPTTESAGLASVMDVFHLFSNSSELTRDEMERLLILLDIGKRSSNNKHQTCLSLDQFYNKSNISRNGMLSEADFKDLCPALVHQIVAKSCATNLEDTTTTMKKVESGKAWGYSILAVTVISLASMLGAFVVPFMNRDFYQKILLFMVALAVGVLGGSGLFHLIPGAFGFSPLDDDVYLWKCAMIVGGIYFFFVTESLMKIYIRFSDWKAIKSRQSRWNPNADNDDKLLPKAIEMPTGNGCLHEHGLDSLHIAGDHQLKSKDASEVFIPDDKSRQERIAPVAWMIIIGDGLHNFIDGLAIGAAFTSSSLEGVSTSLAIFSEELPHELGDFAILLNSGMTYKQAIGFNFLSACTCFVGMAIGIGLGSTTSAVKWIYALAGGMFLYISLVDMLPEATGMALNICGKSKRQTWITFGLVNFAILFGFGIMLLLAIYGPMIEL